MICVHLRLSVVWFSPMIRVMPDAPLPLRYVTLPEWAVSVLAEPLAS
jgi:hypothetical protein